MPEIAPAGEAGPAAEWAAAEVSAGESDMCAACKTRQPLAEMEPVPTSPERLRCQDADACRKRYTPRRLAWSVRAASTR